MSGSCASDFVSSYSPLISTAITAGLSAVVGSLATAFVLRRRRCSGDDGEHHSNADNNSNNDNNAPKNLVNGDVGDVHSGDDGKHHSDADNHSNNNKNAPKNLVNGDVGDAHVDTIIGLRESGLATTFTGSTLSQDHTWQNQEFSHDNDDRVNSMREFLRGIPERHYNAVRSSRQISQREQEEHATQCKCSSIACKSCSAGMRDPKENRTREFCPESVARPDRGRRRFSQRRSSSISRDNPLADSLVSLGSLGSLLSAGSEDENNPSHQRRLSKISMSQINLKEEESYISNTEMKFKGTEGFGETLESVGTDLPDSLRLLRRIRAISALSNRLMAAPDEATCIEEVTRLLVLMFGVERVSFAMLTDTKHFLLKRVNVKRKNEKDSISSSSSFDLEYLVSDCQRPLEGTAAGVCAQTLKEHYTPRTQFSRFVTHKVFYRTGVNTILISPILVNGMKCAGCIMLARKPEDGFQLADRTLISDMGLLLGANIFAKRLLKQANESKKRSREMLHSFIPSKVLEKIECYWDTNSEEYKSRKRASVSTSIADGSIGSNESGGAGNHIVRSNSWYVAQSDWTEADIGNEERRSMEGIKEKVQLLKKLNRGDDDDSDDANGGVIFSTLGMDFSPTTRALYAESVKDVVIIFTDIVGFSRLSMNLSPIKVMDMLQNLFSRFDELCDVHGVLKLETIGDAFICATNLLDADDDGVQDAAMRALAMAKDMIIEATHCKIPCPEAASSFPCTEIHTLEIRVGIHVGDVTCGVLGQRMPKFTTCGTAVNMAARMEQTSLPSCIRVTKDFHDLVVDAQDGWMEKEVLPLKNMGEMETYLLKPMESRIDESF